MTPPSRGNPPFSARTSVVNTRWRDLAEQRLQHFIELYESGRWRRYYSESEFLRLTREVVAAVDAWKALAPTASTSGAETGGAMSLAPLLRDERVFPAMEPIAPVAPALPETAEASPVELQPGRLPRVSPL